MLPLLLVLLAQNKLVFDAPKDSKPADLSAAAKIIHTRISEYGYRGIVVYEGIDNITLESTTPFTEAMRPKLERLVMRRASNLEVWFAYHMTKAESEQFPEPWKVSPPETVCGRYNNGDWFLLQKSPVLQVSGMVTWRAAKDVQGIFTGPFNENMAHLSWNEKATTMIRDHGAMIPKIRLFIDGLNVGAQIHITFTKDTMKWTMSNWDGWDITGICLNHPLSIQFTK